MEMEIVNVKAELGCVGEEKEYLSYLFSKITDIIPGDIPIKFIGKVFYYTAILSDNSKIEVGKGEARGIICVHIVEKSGVKEKRELTSKYFWFIQDEYNKRNGLNNPKKESVLNLEYGHD